MQNFNSIKPLWCIWVECMRQKCICSSLVCLLALAGYSYLYHRWLILLSWEDLSLVRQQPIILFIGTLLSIHYRYLHFIHWNQGIWLKKRGKIRRVCFFSLLKSCGHLNNILYDREEKQSEHMSNQTLQGMSLIMQLHQEDARIQPSPFISTGLNLSFTSPVPLHC